MEKNNCMEACVAVIKDPKDLSSLDKCPLFRGLKDNSVVETKKTKEIAELHKKELEKSQSQITRLNEQIKTLTNKVTSDDKALMALASTGEFDLILNGLMSHSHEPYIQLCRLNKDLQNEKDIAKTLKALLVEKGVSK